MVLAKTKIFGTDGIRGIVKEFPITKEVLSSLTRLLPAVISSENKNLHVVVGRDTRSSSRGIEYVLCQDLIFAGCDVNLLGVIPTAGVSCLTKLYGADLGLMISASHQQYNYNGIKFFNRQGKKLDDLTEQRIEKALVNGGVKNNPMRDGKFRLVEANAREDLKNYIKNNLFSKNFSGLKTVVDCANGAAYPLAPSLFDELGVDTLFLCTEPNGLNINENCGSMYPEHVVAAIKKYKAHIGIALDGDADRVMVADERGKVLDGDDIVYILAKYIQEQGFLNNNAVVVSRNSNLGLDNSLRNLGIKTLRTQIGDKHVRDAMGEYDCSLGGENCGHIIFRDYCSTGDGIFTGLQLMNVMKKEKKTLSELVRGLDKFESCFAEVPIREEIPLGEIPKFQEYLNSIEKKLSGSGRVLVRYSGTEPLLRILVESKKKGLSQKFCGEIKNMYLHALKKR